MFNAGPARWKLGIFFIHGSPWKTARDILHIVDTEMVVVQEVMRKGDQRQRAKQWLAKRGWGSEWRKGWTTEKKRTAGGVAILFRSHMDIGFDWPGVPATVVPGRVVATPVRRKKPGTSFIYSSHLT